MSDPGCLIKFHGQCTYASAKWSALVWLVILIAVILIGPVLVDRARRWWMVRTLTEQQKKLPTTAEAARSKLNEELSRWERPGRVRILGVIAGEDGRLSTTKSIALLWTLVIIYVILALIIVWPQDWQHALRNLTGAYLALLGGPIATVVLSNVIVSSRVRRGTIQKPEGDGVLRFGDLIADDSGNTDLFDLQYILFNIIAVIFVLTGFSKATLDGFPDVPDVLWLLTGGPAAVFVSNKAFRTNAPAIFSVDPARVRRNESFTVYGQNFIVGNADAPADGSVGKVSVQINGVKAEVVQGTVTALSVKATVPDDLPPSDSAVVTVITDAGVPANRSDLLAVLPNPEVWPLPAGHTVPPGGSLTLTGTWNSGPNGPTVLINGVAAASTSTSDHAVVVTVPATTDPGSAQVVVLDTVGQSKPMTIIVA